MRAKFFAAAALSVTVVLGAAACSETGEQPRVQVVVTTDILGDVTRELLGDQVEVLTLMGPGSDPHSFSISAQTAAQMERAELIIYNGLGLEEGVLRIVESAAESGVETLEVGLKVDPLKYTEGGSAGQLDPHFWTDPDRMKLAAEAIAGSIEQHVSGVDVAQLSSNLSRYLGELDELSVWMESEFESIPVQQRSLITNHHVFGYLAERFGFSVIGAIIPSGTTLASPSAADLDSLVRALEASGVSAIFADSTQPDRLAQVVAVEVQRDIVVIPLFTEALGSENEGAASYLEMMRANTVAITEGLSR